jgi:hypothetical protein
MLDQSSVPEERVQEIEELLIAILSKLRTAFNIHGCSHVDCEDNLMVVFNSKTATQPELGFFLKYKPEEKSLIGWASGIDYFYPKDMLDYIHRLFPRSHYEKREKGISVDGFHWFEGISEAQLRKIARKKH